MSLALLLVATTFLADVLPVCYHVYTANKVLWKGKFASHYESSMDANYKRKSKTSCTTNFHYLACIFHKLIINHTNLTLT